MLTIMLLLFAHVKFEIYDFYQKKYLLSIK